MNLIKYILYNQVKIITNRNPDEAIKLLKSHIDGNSSLFEGYINGYKFDMYKRLEKFNRNSFVPVIKGAIREHWQGSEINVVIRLNLLVIIFMVLWTSVILISVLKSIILYHNFLPIFFLGILCIVWLICWQIYDGEVTQATNFLKRLFCE
ncbi:hypothetical protein [Pelosinus sp. UFO1]|uniref:hypothetical protein n=1 Tax=Pelosinus sp. UFO1 TaxID=484770 RepID=UPI0004D172BC|nr:hypothetical protein [Pelosinus sp. UFO1]AIF54140.1 hypothetical protein UFO1_4605 [Pelosinus sp. UFO1]